MVPVFRSVMVTFTPGTTAPELSFTRPSMAPENVCARAAGDVSTSARAIVPKTKNWSGRDRAYRVIFSHSRQSDIQTRSHTRLESATQYLITNRTITGKTGLECCTWLRIRTAAQPVRL